MYGVSRLLCVMGMDHGNVYYAYGYSDMCHELWVSHHGLLCSMTLDSCVLCHGLYVMCVLCVLCHELCDMAVESGIACIVYLCQCSWLMKLHMLCHGFHVMAVLCWVTCTVCLVSGYMAVGYPLMSHGY